MAGRPRAPSEIVPPHTIVPMQNRREHFNLVALLPNIIDTDACLRWLAERRLIRNTGVYGMWSTLPPNYARWLHRRQEVVLR